MMGFVLRENAVIRFSILILFTIIVVSASDLQAKPVRAGHIEAELISENSSIVPGEPFWVALKLRMDDDWHINWQNPGDFGLAPTIAWQLPEGFEAGEIQWPIPQRLIFPPFVGYGYEGQAILPVRIKPPKSIRPGTEIKLEAAADWVVCGEVCVPGGAKSSLELRVGMNKPLADKSWAPLFASFRKAAAKSASSYLLGAELTEKYLLVSVAGNQSKDIEMDSLVFFPDFNGLIKNSASQKLRKVRSGYVLEIERDPMGVTPPERLKGILVLGEKKNKGQSARNIKIDVILEKK